MYWIATYTDGTTLGQYNHFGEASSEDIDRSRLKTFSVISEDGSTVFQLHLDPGQRLIYRRRVEQATGGEPIVCYLVGWQQAIQGETVQSIAYLFDEGKSVELAGQFREDHPWFYPVQFVECELGSQ